MNRSVLCLCLLALMPSIAPAADLLDVYRVARLRDPVTASARWAGNAAKEEPVQAAALLLPNVSTELTVNRSRTLIRGDASTTWPGESKTVVKVPVWAPANMTSLSQSELRAKVAEVQSIDADLALLERVAKAYFDVLQARDNLATSRHQLTAVREQLALTTRSFEVGIATIVDSREAEAKADLAAARELADMSTVELSLGALQVITGEPIRDLSPLRLGSDAILQDSPGTEAWVEAAEATYPTLIIARLNVQILSREIERSTAGHLPTLALEGTVKRDREDLRAAGRSDQDDKLEVKASLPLFSGGGTSSRVRGANASLERARQDLESAQRQFRLQALQAQSDLEAGRRQIAALETAVATNERLLETTTLGREVGLRTTLDVLNSQQQLFQARRDLMATRYATLLAWLRMNRLAGNIDEGTLGQINRSLG